MVSAGIEMNADDGDYRGGLGTNQGTAGEIKIAVVGASKYQADGKLALFGDGADASGDLFGKLQGQVLFENTRWRTGIVWRTAGPLIGTASVGGSAVTGIDNDGERICGHRFIGRFLGMQYAGGQQSQRRYEYRNGAGLVGIGIRFQRVQSTTPTRT